MLLMHARQNDENIQDTLSQDLDNIHDNMH